MKISFSDSEGVLLDYWCARGGKEGPYGFSVSGERVVQVSQFFRAEKVRARGRGNRSVTVEFSVDKEYASLEEAAKVAVGEESKIPHEGTLTVVEDAAQMFMQAAFQNISISQRGVTLTMRYRFVGGGFTGVSGDELYIPTTLPSPN